MRAPKGKDRHRDEKDLRRPVGPNRAISIKVIASALARTADARGAGPAIYGPTEPSIAVEGLIIDS